MNWIKKRVFFQLIASFNSVFSLRALLIDRFFVLQIPQQLIEEPVEKCQFQDELKRKFSIWRMETEQVTFDSQTPGSHVSINQVTSSSDFLIKEEEYEKDSLDRRSSADEERADEAFDKHLRERNSDYDKDSGYDKESYENGSYDKSSFDEFDKNAQFDRESFLNGAFGKDAFEHKFTFVKNIYCKDAELINVIVDY